ncbi:MAG: ATP-binding cassette domain-containing protein [candidate division WOR-3 bacterium]|nr:ATP-binding cassette domain-containing protein [Thermoproteota archaeon]
MDEILKINGLTKIFATGFLKKGKEIYAVRNISLSIPLGCIFGLIGESGSGKSTTAKLIARLLKPDSGEILFKGKNIWSFPIEDYYRHVQLVFQDPYSSFNNVYRLRHTFDNVFRKLRPIPKQQREERIREVLKMLRLTEDILYKYPSELSGGQLQRAALARALLVDPDLLLVDEPTSMVDASLRVTILNSLQNMSRMFNKTIIFITHDISQAYYLCDRIAIMYKGEIVEEGPVDEVIFNPKHHYSKRLISDVPKISKRYETLE